MNFAWELIRVTFYLLIIIGIIYLLAYFYKNRFFQQYQGQNMQLLEQLSLTPKQGLSLVKVKDKVILFAVCENRIEKIEEWDFENFDYSQPPVRRKSFKDYFDKFRNSYRDGRNG